MESVDDLEIMRVVDIEEEDVFTEDSLTREGVSKRRQRSPGQAAYTASVASEVQNVLNTRPTLLAGKSNMTLKSRSRTTKQRAKQPAPWPKTHPLPKNDLEVSDDDLDSRGICAAHVHVHTTDTPSPTVSSRSLSRSNSDPGEKMHTSRTSTVTAFVNPLALHDAHDMYMDMDRPHSAGVRAHGPPILSETAKVTATLLKEHRENSSFLASRLSKRRRVTLQQQTKTVSKSTWGNIKHVKWPKFVSTMKVLLSYKPWERHIKEIEGYFGSAVVSYFVFLRWLFLMNLLTSVLWIAFVCVPQIVWDQTDGAKRMATPSALVCAFNANESYECLDNATASSAHLALDGCFYPERPVFDVRECIVRDGIAVQEGDTVIAVSTSLPRKCNEKLSNISNLTLCANVAPHSIPWYLFVLEFFTGQGIFNDTILFLGHYTTSLTIQNANYNFPLVILVLCGVVYLFNVFLLVYRMGQAYNESYVDLGASRRVNFCSKLFTAWDFNISNAKTAKLKRVYIRTDLEEELSEWDAAKKKSGKMGTASLIGIRILSNTFTMIALAFAGVVIYYTASWDLDLQHSNQTDFITILEGLVLPVVITALNVILPFVFEYLALFEQFKTRKGEIKMTLLRTLLVRLSSLIVLIISLYSLIQCTQPATEITEGENDDQCTVNSVDIKAMSQTNTTRCKIECWETYVGQEFYKLGLIDLVFSVFSTVMLETLQNFVSRFSFGKKIGKGYFNIPKSVLDLIYTQMLLWLGLLFSPLQPVVVLVTFWIVFYVKKYSLMYNLEPERRGVFRAARTNFMFLLLLLASLFSAFVPIGYAIARLKPSSTCGPFRGKESILQVIGELVDSVMNCTAQIVLDYFLSIGFVVPLLIILLLTVYAQFIMLRSRKKQFESIQQQLILEGANMVHLVGGLNRVLRKMASKHRLVSEALQELRESKLQETIEN